MACVDLASSWECNQPERYQALQKRKVILFPDAGAWQKWQAGAQKLVQHLDISVKVSDWLERHASPAGLAQGIDLADCLLQQPEYEAS